MVLRRRTWFLLGLLFLSMASFVLFGLAYREYSRASAGYYPFISGFESGDLSEWSDLGASQLCCPHSIEFVEDPIDPGNRVARFTIRRDDPILRKRHRAELRTKGTELGKNYWYEFSVLVPEGWVAGPREAIAAQWHGVRDRLWLEAVRSPPLAIGLVDEEFVVTTRWDSQRITRTVFESFVDWTAPSRGQEVVARLPLNRGQWTHWGFHVRWSWESDGLIEVFCNDELIARRSGPNAFRDDVGPYLKVGVYVPYWRDMDPRTPDVTDRRSLYHDAIEVREVGPGFRVSSE